ncbi:MAG TPA: tRNA (adenosine(37)-N6)-threonylcarbamoyltransferase complex dimerization subunit type 1 TsaB [Chloroflexota bacterium]|nr:tRNA (adenosine(37)-N6)-threonylcarbamoyltransferase complex dimerization subunit type 1 TsaB [Chloroflexota bacterium]
MTLLLALDTSTRIASVAVHDGEQVLSETTWLAGREHSTRLLVEAEAALQRIGKTPTDLTGVAVATGPGSFTGVRVALSVAKGLAAGLGVPLWGVSTLDAMAHSASGTDLPVRVVLEAGRARMATALYGADLCVEAPRLATLDQLMTLLVEPTLVIGELTLEARTALADMRHVRVAPPAGSLRRAGFLAELAVARMRSGDPGNPRAVDAVYIS